MKYTLAQILDAWDASYGEDMMEEYPGFIQRLSEETDKETDIKNLKEQINNEQTAWPSQYQNISAALALARGPGTKLQAASCKLQATSGKLDKTAVQCYCIL